MVLAFAQPQPTHPGDFTHLVSKVLLERLCGQLQTLHPFTALEILFTPAWKNVH